MICVDINGEIGNQLFQYASGLAIARKNHTDFCIDISPMDTAYHRNANPIAIREYALSQFSISVKPLKTRAVITKNKICRLINRYQKFIEMGHSLSIKFIFGREAWTYDEKLERCKKNAYLCGFFQSWRYFDLYREILMEEFRPQKKYISSQAAALMEDCRANKRSVGVHIRRGNYKVCRDWLIDESFFVEAIGEMKALFNQDIALLVFCNEPGFAEALLTNEQNVHFVSAEGFFSGFEEFSILSACANQIISNSSFSWWAAYLNQNQKKKVIALVFNHWREDYYLPDWMMLPAQSAGYIGGEEG